MTQVNEGILLINKSKGRPSFQLISGARRRFGIRKIGHAGTLDPFADGVMILLVGRSYTKLSDKILTQDKTYETTLFLGKTTDSFDCEGEETSSSSIVPSLEQVKEALAHFQGNILQTPPMFSAKKIKGQKLYHLARQGITIERQPVNIWVSINFLSYNYPELKLEVSCSKGTYIRSLGHDIGQHLGCGAHLTSLTRTRSGSFYLKECIDDKVLFDTNYPLPHLRQHVDLSPAS